MQQISNISDKGYLQKLSMKKLSNCFSKQNLKFVLILINFLILYTLFKQSTMVFGVKMSVLKTIYLLFI